MALDTVPPWLQIHPSMFTQALEAGSRVGLGIAEMQQRAQEAALNRSMRERELEDAAQQRAAAAAERSKEFDAEQQFNREKLAQTQAYEAAREARLGQYDLAKTALEQAKEQTAQRKQAAADENQKAALGLREKVIDAQLAKLNADKTKAETMMGSLTDRDAQTGESTTFRGTAEQIADFKRKRAEAAAAANPNVPAAPSGPSLWDRIGNYFSQPSAPGTNPLLPPTSMFQNSGASPMAPVAPVSPTGAGRRYLYRNGQLTPVGDQEAAPIDVESEVQPER